MAATLSFADVLKQLQDSEKTFPPTSLYHFSDLRPQDMVALRAVWSALTLERRRNVMSDLLDLSEANYEVTIIEVFRLGLTDEDGLVRASAVRGLWEDEDPALIAVYIKLLQTDPVLEARAAAASALGRYVYLGEIDEISPENKQRAEAALLACWRGTDDLEVRRRALEAIAFSTRSEVPELISDAYAASESKLRVSAVFAMGRSADAVWAPQVLAELNNAASEIRFEAIRAAGELEITEAVDTLVNFFTDDDAQISEAAIWSLSQIGGDDAREALTQLLEETEDEEEQDFIEEALENLEFTDDLHKFAVLDIDEPDEDVSRLN